VNRITGYPECPTNISISLLRLERIPFEILFFHKKIFLTIIVKKINKKVRDYLLHSVLNLKIIIIE
jgi:hypothetical protein